jgi:hypothetical protein
MSHIECDSSNITVVQRITPSFRNREIGAAARRVRFDSTLGLAEQILHAKSAFGIWARGSRFADAY